MINEIKLNNTYHKKLKNAEKTNRTISKERWQKTKLKIKVVNVKVQVNINIKVRVENQWSKSKEYKIK